MTKKIANKKEEYKLGLAEFLFLLFYFFILGEAEFGAGDRGRTGTRN
jgi:hypothetical protein